MLPPAARRPDHGRTARARFVLRRPLRDAARAPDEPDITSDVASPTYPDAMSGPTGPMPPIPPAVPPHGNDGSAPSTWGASVWSTAPAPTTAPEGGRGAEPPAPRRRRALVAVVVVLAVALVAAAYLWRSADSWATAAADWEALARQHGEEVAVAQAEIEALSSELEATRGQLTTAQARITELADEKARLGDTTAAQQQLADYQARVSQAAGQVATALASCIDGQERLIGYLEEASRYDPADLQRFRGDVERVCGSATDANTSLQRELSR